MNEAAAHLPNPCPHPAPSPAGAAGRPLVDRHARLAFLAAAGAIALGALLVRTAGAAQAFAGGAFVPLDGDSQYHLHRMRLAADAFPRVPWRDPMIAWPDGGPVPWAAGFDLLGAAAIRLGRAVGGAAAGDLWAAALSPLLGVLVVVAAMELAHALRRGAPGRRGAALAAGILAAAIPQGLDISRFGRLDHHPAEALSLLLLARWALAALPADRERGRRARLLHELAGALLSAGAVAVFTGSPLYVALVLPVLAAAALAAPRPPLVGSGGPGLVAGGALVALASAPAVAAHGRALAFGFPSFLQPLLVAAAGCAVCGVALVGARVRPGARRAAAAAAVFGAASIGGALLVPHGAAEAWAGMREWLLKGDPWLRSIDEFQPLLRHPGGPAAGVARFLGWAGLAAPVLLPLGFAASAPAGRGRAAAFAWVTSAVVLLTLHQSRFGRVLVPFLAVAAAVGIAGLLARIAASAAPVLCAAVIALLDPRVRAAVRNDDGEPDAAVEAALDLRARPTGPAPGVLAPWDLGNAFLLVAGRPVMATGFGPYPDPAAYWESVHAYKVGEGELLPWLASRRAAWVVAGAANLFGRVPGVEAAIPFSGRGYSARWLTEVPSAPLLIGGSGVPALGVRHFERLMPVFASTRTVVGIDGALPVLWTYEVVAGARVVGRAAPGERVVLEIPLVEHGRPHTWRAFADAGADGRFALTVPLPTDLATATIATAPALLKAGAAAPRAVRVPEAAVRAGATVELEERRPATR